MNNEIILTWREQGKDFSKSIKRRCLMATFKGLAEGFANNNEISKKLLKVIPEATMLHINWDCTSDVNRVYYTINETTNSIPIINAHNVVWAVLRKYCNTDVE